MEVCKISIILAYLASTYIISSIIYLIITRSFGTPFKNALNKYPELKKIKMDAVRKRKIAFYSGVCISVILLCIFTPFKNCNV